MRKVKEIEVELEQLETRKKEIERKITEARAELTAAQSIEPPEAEQPSQPAQISDAFVTEQIKQFNRRRANAAPNPLQMKEHER
jgi:hypothetical protein